MKSTTSTIKVLITPRHKGQYFLIMNAWYDIENKINGTDAIDNHPNRLYKLTKS